MRRLLGLLRREDEELALAPQPGLAHLDQPGRDRARGRTAGRPARRGRRRAAAAGVDVAAYRIVQEALTNALSTPARPRARPVRYGLGEVELEIADTAPAPAAGNGGGGHGLVGMRERVDVLRRRLEARPAPRAASRRASASRSRLSAP